MSTLTLRRGAIELLVIPLGDARQLFGRSDECHHQIPDPAVSRRQFAIELRGAIALLINLAEAGTSVDGVRVREQLELRDGARIALGKLEAVYQPDRRVDFAAATIVPRTGDTRVLRVPGPTPADGKLRFRVRRFGKQERAFELERDFASLGSAATNDVVLDDPTISAKHARIYRDGPQLYVEDLQSKNGVFVDGTRVVIAPLAAGSVVRLGETELLFGPAEERAGKRERLPGVVGESPALDEVTDLALRVAPSGATVLLLGDTGTGKSLLARGVHQSSSRKDKPFLVVDCTQLETNLMASELFGHEKGAFTGADRERKGAFEEADGGTVFIDEIGELPLELQPKLLRVLEEGEVKRVGSNQHRKVDVRVIAATHRDLEQMVAEKKFREDLYFRIKGVTLYVPSLRERRADIVPLAESFLDAMRPPGRRLRLGASAKQRLMSYAFPGNVRELRQAIQRALALALGEVIEAEDLGLVDRSTADREPRIEVRPAITMLTLGPGKALAQHIWEIIDWALRRSGGEKKGAWEELEISRNHLDHILDRTDGLSARFLERHPEYVDERSGPSRKK